MCRDLYNLQRETRLNSFCETEITQRIKLGRSAFDRDRNISPGSLCSKLRPTSRNNEKSTQSGRYCLLICQVTFVKKYHFNERKKKKWRSINIPKNVYFISSIYLLFSIKLATQSTSASGVSCQLFFFFSFLSSGLEKVLPRKWFVFG